MKGKRDSQRAEHAGWLVYLVAQGFGEGLKAYLLDTLLDTRCPVNQRNNDGYNLEGPTLKLR